MLQTIISYRMGAAHAAAHPRAHPKPLVFETFYEALNKVPNTNKGKMIVDGLKLQPTLSNPKLALTVFMPEDKVREGGAAVGNQSTQRQQPPAQHEHECERVWVLRTQPCAEHASDLVLVGAQAACGQQFRSYGCHTPRTSSSQMTPSSTAMTAPKTGPFGAPGCMTTPPTRPCFVPMQYFDALSRKLNVNPNSMGKNVGLMKQVCSASHAPRPACAAVCESRGQAHLVRWHLRREFRRHRRTHHALACCAGLQRWPAAMALGRGWAHSQRCSCGCMLEELFLHGPDAFTSSLTVNQDRGSDPHP
jgi:hypothetical protein